MAKYDINYSCGHSGVVQLFGKSEERQKRIAYFERCGICPDCYREQKEIEKSIGCEEVEMDYREYKEKYPRCKTKAGSYNGTTKTIVVYVPAKN